MGDGTIVLDVLLVGAGQAGLVTGFHLQQTGLTFQLFDRVQRVGDSWRHRYDSLTLFSPRRYSALPGAPLGGDSRGYPGKDEIAYYLERYAHTLPVNLGDGIARLEHVGPGFTAYTDTGRRIDARAVVVATGAFQQCVVPAFAGGLLPRVLQLTATSYRNPGMVPDGKVLVVGGGATGRQIARELAASHAVSLSVGHSPGIAPQRVLGRDIIEWVDALGFLRADKDTLKGRLARARESFPGSHLRSAALQRRGVRLKARTIDARDALCCFADGTAERFDAVIWALGYRDDSRWLAIPGAIAPNGNYAQERGITRVPGLFHVGRSWQTSRASALLTGVSADAAAIVRRAAESLERRHTSPLAVDSTRGARGMHAS